MAFYNDFTAAITAGRDKIASLLEEIAELEVTRTSGKYSQQYIQANVEPKLMELRKQIRAVKDETAAAAKAIVQKRQEELILSDELDPSQITDDVRLFTCGVKLTANDVNGILRRNESNRTMTQLALRYAEENGITLGVRYDSGRSKVDRVGELNEVVDVYMRWIDQPNAVKMYEQFFGAGSPGEAAAV